jgi:hypothetical protein
MVTCLKSATDHKPMTFERGNQRNVRDERHQQEEGVPIANDREPGFRTTMCTPSGTRSQSDCFRQACQWSARQCCSVAAASRLRRGTTRLGCERGRSNWRRMYAALRTRFPAPSGACQFEPAHERQVSAQCAMIQNPADEPACLLLFAPDRFFSTQNGGSAFSAVVSTNLYKPSVQILTGFTVSWSAHPFRTLP